MLARMYRAYCRSCTAMACDPRVLGLAILVLFGLGDGLGTGAVRGSRGIAHVLACSGAFALTLIAAALLIWAARITARATGHHADPATLPVQVPAVTKPVPVPVPMPPAPSWPSRLVTGRVSQKALALARTLPPDPETTAADMAAQADAYRDEHIVPAVSADGILYETARRES